MKEILFELKDSKERPLITVRTNGLTSFYRYAEMDKKDRELILKFFTAVKKKDKLCEAEKDKTIKDIEAFLNYETDDDFCG